MLPIAEQTLRTELLVVGGGPSGILCALAAARQGARVTLSRNMVSWAAVLLSVWRYL